MTCLSHTSLLLFKFLVKYFFVLLCLNNPTDWPHGATAATAMLPSDGRGEHGEWVRVRVR